MFPDYPIAALIDDLRQTRSLDVTIENILDGRLLPTIPSFQQEPSLSTMPTYVNQETSREAYSEPDNIFVEDPQERQQILQCRKHDLLEEARNRFLQRQARNNTSMNVEWVTAFAHFKDFKLYCGYNDIISDLSKLIGFFLHLNGLYVNQYA